MHLVKTLSLSLFLVLSVLSFQKFCNETWRLSGEKLREDEGKTGVSSERGHERARKRKGGGQRKWPAE